MGPAFDSRLTHSFCFCLVPCPFLEKGDSPSQVGVGDVVLSSGREIYEFGGVQEREYQGGVVEGEE